MGERKERWLEKQTWVSTIGHIKCWEPSLKRALPQCSYLCSRTSISVLMNVCAVKFVRLPWLTVGWLHLLQPGPPFSMDTVSTCLHLTHTRPHTQATQSHKGRKSSLRFSHQAELQETQKTEAANVPALMHMEMLACMCNVICVSVSESTNVWVDICCAHMCQQAASVWSTLACSDDAGLF